MFFEEKKMAKYKVAKNLTGRHRETTEASDPIAVALSKVGARVSAGRISVKGIIRTNGCHIKMRTEPSRVVLTVLSKLGKQELHVFNLPAEKVEEKLRTLEGYSLRTEG